MSIKEQLYPHQAKMANWLYAHRAGGIICNATATGKKFSALATSKALKAFPLLVVCQDYQFKQWQYEIQRIKETIQEIVVIYDYNDLNESICEDFNNVIFDDIDCITRATLEKITPFFKDYEILLAIAEQIKHTTRIELWPIFDLLKRSKLFERSRETFGHKYCGAVQTWDSWEYEGASNDYEFNKLLDVFVLALDDQAINNFNIVSNVNSFLKKKIIGKGSNLLILDSGITDLLDATITTIELNRSMSFDEIKTHINKGEVFYMKDNMTFKVPLVFDHILYSRSYSLPGWDFAHVKQHFYTRQTLPAIDSQSWKKCCQSNDIGRILEIIDDNKLYKDFHWNAITQCLSDLSKHPDIDIADVFLKALPKYVCIIP
jgi:hypothetical protein